MKHRSKDGVRNAETGLAGYLACEARVEEFVGVIEAFDGILTRLDLRPEFHNVVQELSGPGEAGFLTLHHAFGYETFAANGQALDTLFADAEFLELFGGILSEEGPASSRSGSSGQILFQA